MELGQKHSSSSVHPQWVRAGSQRHLITYAGAHQLITHGGGPLDGEPLDAEPWLTGGVVQEWFEPRDESLAAPPLYLLMHLAGAALRQAMDAGTGGWVVWIGRWCWPYPRALSAQLLDRSIFVDPPDTASRLWAIDLAARQPAVAAIVGDGRRLSMAATRRLQLAARPRVTSGVAPRMAGPQTGGGAVVLVAREAREIEHLSAAAMRWVVRTVATQSSRPRWEAKLVRCKGLRRGHGMEAQQRTWLWEWNHATGLIALPADVGDRQDSAPAPTRQVG